MKTVYSIILSLVITGTRALASGGVSEGGELGLLTMFFTAFAVLIVIFQFIPGFILFFGMIRGLFLSADKKSAEIR